MQKYRAYEYTGDTLIYDPGEVDRELALHKAEIDRLQMDANGTDWLGSLYAKGLEINLLKAALRWAFNELACAGFDGEGNLISGVDGCVIDIPPEFAPLIAEATK